MKVLETLPVPLPPLSEQEQIVKAIDIENARIDTLIEKSKRSIDLLKKRRSARLTAAAHQEKHFEDYVVSRLKAQGWKVGDTKHYDTEHALT